MSANSDKYWAQYARSLEESVPESLARLGISARQLRKWAWIVLILCGLGAGLLALPI